ncbi:MAG: hypothetical protein AABZ60_01975 [Planctomycetota bacterium]
MRSSASQDWILSTRFWPTSQFSSFFQQALKKQFLGFGVTSKTLPFFPQSHSLTPEKYFFSHLIWDLPIDLFSEKRLQNEVQKLLDVAQIAKQYQIPAVVLECFELPTTDAAKRFDKMLVDLQDGTPKAQEILKTWKADRQGNQKEVLLALCRLLFSLLKREQDVLFCLTPRYRLDQIPLSQEISSVFEELKRFPHLRYWHHTAYAHLQEQLGFQPQEDWLEQCGSRLYGITLQDAIRYQVGLPPGIGDVSFDILNHLPAKCFRALEFSELNSWLEIDLGISHLNTLPASS